MTSVILTRKNLSFAQQIAIDRRGNPYVYGGNWDPFKRAVGTDCSGCIVDVLDASINGTAMAWTRHNLSTENWRPPSMGGGADPNNGPFGTIMVDNPSEFPPDAVVLLAFHHGPGGGANSHTWCQVDQLKVETMGGNDTLPDGGTVLNNGANFNDETLDVHDTSYGNNWWYLPGPIIEDGTPIPAVPSGLPSEPPDTLFPDVSEFQAPVDDSFLRATYSEAGGNWPYRWISIRSNDGAHVDNNFAANYQLSMNAANAGQLDGFIVYYYWRPGNGAVDNHMSLVSTQGGPHPKMVSMIDVESGDGNPGYDVSGQINSDYATLQNWLGAQRVIGYANAGDFAALWPTRPVGLRVIGAGYGANPLLPGQIAHQYTNGQGYGGGLPEGVAPFGNCDMNSADGYTPTQLANALGVGSVAPAPILPLPPTPTPAPISVSNVPAIPKPTDQAAQISQVWDQLLLRWDILNGRTLVEVIADLHNKLGI